MNDMTHDALDRADDPASAFTFTGNWREFAPIAFTNLLLTIVTLGIYRFWAKARERRYLWSRTRFIDDRLEWTGTGLEMSIGFLIVMAALVPVLLIFQFGVQALILRGEFGLGFSIGAALYAGLFYLFGVAVFRALRYRLSRTYWHGIRGGSDHQGWDYGLSALWKTVAGALTLGLLIPWSMTSLWNERWSKMSFGPHPFEANADSSGLMGRWLLVYLAAVIGVVILMVVAVAAGFAAASSGAPADPDAMMGAVIVGTISFYVILLLASLVYYAAFYRKVIGATSVGGVEFAFTARSKDWLKLILGNIGLVIVTLGVGLLFISYRNWSFFVRHMEAVGNVELGDLTQSTARSTGDAEGLASAFDIGAI